MSTADIAVIVNGITDLAATSAAWSLVKSGRVRLSSPTPAQPQATAEPAADRPVPVLEVAS